MKKTYQALGALVLLIIGTTTMVAAVATAATVLAQQPGTPDIANDFGDGDN